MRYKMRIPLYAGANNAELCETMSELRRKEHRLQNLQMQMRPQGLLQHQPALQMDQSRVLDF
jgi:hypothetical protein